MIGEQVWQLLDHQRGRTRAPVFGYKFSYTSPYTPIAAHITDVPFVFGTLTPQFIVGSRTPPAEADRAMSETMMSYWTNFATRRDPNGAGLPRWPSFRASGAIQLLASSVTAGTNPDVARFGFIARYRQDGLFPPGWRSLPH